MTETPPDDDELAPGFPTKMMTEAIRKSGYPFQLSVAARLDGYSMQHEWSYLDRDDGKFRALDLHATRWLTPHDAEPHPRTYPELHLFVECKRSHRPFLFFAESPESNWPLAQYPLISSTTPSHVTLHTDDDVSTYSTPIAQTLGLTQEPFCTKAAVAVTAATAERKSGRIELSGDTAYRDLVLPLVKAACYHAGRVEAARKAYYGRTHLVLLIAVLDAPMFLVHSGENGEAVERTSWVRLARHETDPESSWHEAGRHFAVDVVHADYFEEFIRQQVNPFADTFGHRVMTHANVLVAGRGFAPGIGHDWRVNLDGLQAWSPPRRRAVLRKHWWSLFRRK